MFFDPDRGSWRGFQPSNQEKVGRTGGPGERCRRRSLVARGAANAARPMWRGRRRHVLQIRARRAEPTAPSPPRRAPAPSPPRLARLRGEPARPGPGSFRRRGPSGGLPGAGRGHGWRAGRASRHNGRVTVGRVIDRAGGSRGHTHGVSTMAHVARHRNPPETF